MRKYGGSINEIRSSIKYHSRILFLIPGWHPIAPQKALFDARAEEWSSDDRTAAAAEFQRIYERYMSDEYTQALNAIHQFTSNNQDYADRFLLFDISAEEYKKVSLDVGTPSDHPSRIGDS